MVRSGDSVMLLNHQTNGFLVFDMSDRITSHEEAYACTSMNKQQGPQARSVFHIRKADGTGGNIKFGDKVRFESNSYIYAKTLHLHSQ